jgi:hypothetical protein
VRSVITGGSFANNAFPGGWCGARSRRLFLPILTLLESERTQTAAAEAAEVDLSCSPANFTSCGKDKWGSEIRFLDITVLAGSRNPVQNLLKTHDLWVSQQSLQRKFACAISSKSGKICVQGAVLGKLIPSVVANPASSLHPLQSFHAVQCQARRTKRQFLRRYRTTIMQGKKWENTGGSTLTPSCM